MGPQLDRTDWLDNREGRREHLQEAMVGAEALSGCLVRTSPLIVVDARKISVIYSLASLQSTGSGWVSNLDSNIQATISTVEGKNVSCWPVQDGVRLYIL